MRRLLGLVVMGLLVTTLGGCNKVDHLSTAPPPGGVSIGTDAAAGGKQLPRPPKPQPPPPLNH
jgi:hypothetical protein